MISRCETEVIVTIDELFVDVVSNFFALYICSEVAFVLVTSDAK